MSNYNHQLFIDESIALLKSIVLKSEYSALHINELLSLNPAYSNVDLADKTTWKYYLNLAGKRHASDPVLKVVSMDTKEEIEFTPENLVIHTATARAYQPGQQKYKELIKTYPGMEVLIHGVLFPVPMAKAIEARDFTILNWSRDLVEPQEENLIPELQSWIYGQIDRFYVQAMDMAEELYTATFIGCLYPQMLQQVITSRQAVTKTDRAHSFHVRTYLASHRRLDKFYDQLDYRQRMFLYKNIKHILVNAGHNDTFDWLQDEILTRRGLPLAQYTAEQIVASTATTELPTVAFISNSLSRVPSLAARSINTVEMLAKEVSLAPGNLDEISSGVEDIEARLAYGALSSVDTKVLESSMLQTTEGSSRSLQDTALSMWALAAGTGRFTTFVYFTDPVSGEQIGLSAIDAYHYFMYAYFQAMGVQMKTIPPVIAIEAPLWPKPTFAALYSSLDPTFTTQAFAQRMYNLAPTARSFMNNDQFHAFVESQATVLNQMYTYAALPDSLIGRGDALRILDVLNHTQLVHRPEEGDSFEDFLVQRQLPVSGLSPNQWKEMYGEIFEKATGQQLTQVEARSAMQQSMVRLMSHLSSYSVQFVSQIAGSQVTSLRWSAMRFGESIENGGMVYTANLWPFRIISEDVLTGPTYIINIPNLFLKYAVTSRISNVEHLDMNCNVSSVGGEAMGASGLQFGVRMTEQWKEGPSMINDLEDISWMPPLPSKDLRELNDRYTSLCRRYPTLPDKVDLADFVRSERLNSFYALGGVNRVLRGWQGFSAARQLRYFGNDLTVIVLDAFREVYGDVEADVFEMMPLVSLLELFKLATPVGDDPFQNFVYTGDVVEIGQLTYGATLNDVTIGSFKLRQSEVKIPSAAYVGSRLEMQLKHRGKRLSFSFRVATPKYSLLFRYNGHSMTLNTKPAAGTVVANFYFSKRPLVLDPIRFSYRNMNLGIHFVFAHPNYRMPKPKYGSTRAYNQLRFPGTKVIPTVTIKGISTTHALKFRGNMEVDGVDEQLPPNGSNGSTGP